MPVLTRHKTKYPEVFYIMGKAKATGKPERVYYIRYRKDGKRIEEKAGRQFQDDMTPAKAARVRVQKIEGKQLSNKAKRGAEIARKAAEDSKWTIERLWEEYKLHNPNLKGIVVDQNKFGNYIKPNFGKKEPKDIIPLDVDRLRLKLLKEKAPGTVKNALEILRRVINFGAKKALCERLSFTIEMPKVTSLKTEDLNPEQMSNLLKAIDEASNIQAANMMKMALFTGMRRGELFKLKWDHIDYERGFIDIVDPKGGPDQKIPLNDAARELLQSHPRTKSQFIFPGRNGNQRTDIKHQVNKIRDAAGLPKDFRALHGLRHTFASMLASSGEVDLYTLQKLLTHKDPKTTMRYAHLRDEALKRASNLAGDIITEAQKKESGVVALKIRKKV